MIRSAPLVLASALIASCQAAEPSVDPFAGGQWVDLTHTLDKQSVFWPTDGGSGARLRIIAWIPGE